MSAQFRSDHKQRLQNTFIWHSSEIEELRRGTLLKLWKSLTMFRHSCHGAWCIFLIPLVIFCNGCKNVVLLPLSLSTVITSLVLAWRVIGPVHVSLVNGRQLKQNYRYDFSHTHIFQKAKVTSNKMVQKRNHFLALAQVFIPFDMLWSRGESVIASKTTEI